jgi:hypothetical protein
MYKTIFKNFIIKADFLGDKRSSWNDSNYNNHKVTIYNKDNKKSCSFEYWASVANPKLRSKYDILNAFYCFVSDCVAGIDGFDDFCSEFRYNNDSIKAHNIYKACQKSLKKLKRIYDGDLYELLNKLSEIAG